MPGRGRACHGNGERQRRDVDGKRKQSRAGSSRSVLSRCLPPRPRPSRSLKTHPGRDDSAGHARHHGLGQHRERELRWRREEKRREEKRREEKRREEEEIGVRAAGRRFDYFFPRRRGSSSRRLLLARAKTHFALSRSLAPLSLLPSLFCSLSSPSPVHLSLGTQHIRLDPTMSRLGGAWTLAR